MKSIRLVPVRVCLLSALSDPGAKGFSPPNSCFSDEYFLTLAKGKLNCFSNLCPHAGQPLNWAPNKFLSRDGELIVCSTHGATYDSASGSCRGGPCRGKQLNSWPVYCENGYVIAKVPSKTDIKDSS